MAHDQKLVNGVFKVRTGYQNMEQIILSSCYLDGLSSILVILNEVKRGEVSIS